MRTIAQKYRDEGIQIGEKKGIRMGQEKGKLEGKLEGKEEGKLEGKEEIAKSMLLRDYPIEDIIALTGLSPSRIRELV